MHGGSDSMAVDWRQDLLEAIHEVFAKEREALHSDLRTYRLLNPTENQNHLEELEKAISNQVNVKKHGY